MKRASFLKMCASTLSALLYCAVTSFGTITIVPQPPALTTVVDGSNVTLTVGATSDTSLRLRYQWYKNTSEAVVGQTTNKLTLNAVKASHAGTYTLFIEEVGASPPSTHVSDPAVVVVNVRPKILNHPVSLSLPASEGGSATYSVTMDASGATPFVFTWQKKVGTTYVPYVDLDATVSAPTAHSSQLTIANLALADAGTYRVSVTNATGTVVNSKDVVLKVNTRPVILTNVAANLNVPFGATGTLKVVVGGNAPFTYKWFKNNAAINGSNSASLTIKGTDKADAGIAEGPGTYRVEISNAYSPPGPPVVWTLSSDSLVRVIRKPKIVSQPIKPATTLNITGGPLPFSLNVGLDLSGDPGAFTYQWQKDGKNVVDVDGDNIFGPQTANLSFSPSIEWKDRGSYKVIVRNEVGSVTSVAVPLTVISPPVILSGPGLNIFGATKGSVKLTVVAGGTTPLAYEWFFRPVGGSFGSIPIGKAATLTLSNLTATNTGDYKCRVTNQTKPVSTGSVESGLTFLQVDDPPKIITQTSVVTPAPDPSFTATAKVPVGGKVRLKVVVNGTDTVSNPMVFRWQKGTTDIVGAPNASQIDLVGLGLADSGSYRCIISNYSAAPVISTPLVISVKDPVVIVTQPGDAIGYEDFPLSTGPIVATGYPTIKYVWQKQVAGPVGPTWITQTGQSASKLTFAKPDILLHAGTYKCIVSNEYGPAVETDPVTVTVDPIPVAVLGPVAGVSAVDFFPTIAQSGELVRIFGTELQYTTSVKFGTVSATTFIKESNNSLLVTVPATAPTTATSIEVGSKNGTDTTTTLFTRTAKFANDFDNATILNGTSFSFKGDSSTVDITTPGYPVYYQWNIAKKSKTVKLNVVGTTDFDPAISTYIEVKGTTTPGLGQFFGPDGVTVFRPYVRTSPNGGSGGGSIPGRNALLVINTAQDDLELLIQVHGEPTTITGLKFFGAFTGNFLAVPED